MVSKWRALYPRAPWSLLSWHCIRADPTRLSINGSSWRQVQQHNKLHCCTLCLHALRSKKAAAFRRCFRNKRTQSISPGWGGAVGTEWCEDRSTHGSCLVPQPWWAPSTGWSLGTGTGTAKPLPQKRAILQCLQLSIQRDSSLHWLAELSKDPSPASLGKFLPPARTGCGGISHTLTPYQQHPGETKGHQSGEKTKAQ